MEKVYTVSLLNTEVQGYLKQRYSATIWVQGEIKNFNRNSHRDHIFFELCEKDPQSEKTLAKVTAVIFDGVKPRIASSLRRTGDGFQLQDDIEVKFECLIDLYPPSGSYQLKIVDIDPFYTVGKIAQQRYAILETLKKEGLLEENKTLEVPCVPLRIGLITSYNSAAYHDFLKELSESRYGFCVDHVDARMQGQQVETDVCRALRLLNQRSVDIIVIIRGGGSRSDMAWFDNLRIGREVAQSQIPVFTGLGHEIDLSVTDLTAHTYHKTPTAAAQYLVELVRTFLERLEQRGKEILQRGNLSVQDHRHRLLELERETDQKTRSRLENNHRSLQDTAWQVRQFYNVAIRQTLLQLGSVSERIGLKTEARFQRCYSQVEVLSVRRDALDPIRVLRRGYTLSVDSQGRILRRLSAVRLGDVVTTVLTDGQIRSRVTEKRRLPAGENPLAIEKALL